jgi:hypothetical protein
MLTPHKEVNEAIRDLVTELIKSIKSADVTSEREGIALERALARFAEQIIKEGRTTP